MEQGPLSGICQAILSQLSSTGSLGTFLYDAIKTKKMLLRYAVLKNLSFNTVEESDLEDMFREGCYPLFKYFLTKLANEILLNVYY